MGQANMKPQQKPDYTRTREEEAKIKEKAQKELDKKLGNAMKGMFGSGPSEKSK